MKNVGRNLALVLCAGLLSSNAFAIKILKSTAVSTKNNDGKTVVTAFRDADACLSWYYLPGHYNKNPGMYHYVGPSRIDLPQADNGTTTALGYSSIFRIQATPYSMSAAESDVLRKKIVSEIQAQINGENPDFKHCPKSVKTSQLSLNSLLVKYTGGHANKQLINNGKPQVGGGQKAPTVYSELVLGENYRPNDGYFDPYAVLPVNYVLDASDRNAVGYAQSFGNSKDVNLGTVNFTLSSRTVSVNSTYTVKGKMSAEFDSELKKTKCTTNSDDKSGNGVMGAIVGGLMAGPTGAAIGGFLGGAFGGSSRHVVTCEYKLITQMTKGNTNMKVKIDHRGTDFKNKFVTLCNEDECKKFPLRDYIEFKFHEAWANANMDYQFNKISEGVFDITLGRQGPVNADVNFEFTLLESEFDDIVMLVPVYAKELERKDIDYVSLKDSVAKCFQRKYLRQSLLYKDLLGRNLIPVDTSCIGAGE